MSGPLVGKAYPFIDIAVLDGVRERLAAGDALCILTPALDEVLWSNASGARLLGFDGMGDRLGADPAFGPAARRQIEAAVRGMSVAVRLSAGVSTRLAMIEVEDISLPDGGNAVLLAEKTGNEKPAAWIEGLDGDGGHAAVIGAGGELISGSSGFASLGIGQIELAKLAGELRFEADRMVKRMVPSARGMLPAGIGLICDEPPRGLLLIVDSSEELAEPVANLPVTEPQVPAREQGSEPIAPLKASRHYFAAEALDDIDLVAARQPVRPKPPSSEVDEEPVHFPEPALSPEEQEDAIATEDIEDEGSVLITYPDESEGAPVLIPLDAEPEAMTQPDFMPDMAELPVRFAWRISATGAFSEVSPEFARAVGPHSADIVGRTFRDVARVYGLDPGEEISDLIDRRDTWSGRSVLWPIEGTDLRAPVDLAALPVYDRDRKFEGFKGFGIVRIADAIVDAEGIGLSLIGPMSEAARNDMPEQNPDVEEVADAAPSADPAPRPEKPVLIIVAKQEPDFASDDKVVRLEPRRAPRNEPAPAPSSLSDVERSAFREIAERLRESEAPSRPVFGKRAAPPEMTDEAPVEAPDFDEIEDVGAVVEPDLDTAASDEADQEIAEGIEETSRVEESAPPLSAADEEARLKYEAMLRDLIETVEKPVAPDLAEEAEAEATAPLDYDAMLRDILETADKPPIDGKMIRVMPAEEILRVAEEHHQQDLESLAQDGEVPGADDLPLAATDDRGSFVGRRNRAFCAASGEEIEPRWPVMSAESPTLPPNLDAGPS